MGEASKTANTAVRTLTSDEILAVSGGARLKVLQPGGGNRQGHGGGILGQILGEIFHTGRRAIRELPVQVV